MGKLYIPCEYFKIKLLNTQEDVARIGLTPFVRLYAWRQPASTMIYKTPKDNFQQNLRVEGPASANPNTLKAKRCDNPCANRISGSTTSNFYHGKFLLIILLKSLKIDFFMLINLDTATMKPIRKFHQQNSNHFTNPKPQIFCTLRSACSGPKILPHLAILHRHERTPKFSWECSRPS